MTEKPVFLGVIRTRHLPARWVQHLAPGRRKPRVLALWLIRGGSILSLSLIGGLRLTLPRSKPLGPVKPSSRYLETVR